MYDQIVEVYEANKNPGIAKDQKAYMKDNFEFFGIKSPERKELNKPFLKEVKNLSKDEFKKLIQQLWDRPEREMHYVAMELIRKMMKKHISEKKDMDFLQKLALQNSWWDSIDFIAPRPMKVYFDRFPEERDKKVDEWIASDNIWLKRCALLIHLKQSDEVDLPYMFKTILRLNNTKEFFIDKAIGWLLREHSKKRKNEIQQFIDQYGDKLSKLSIREGSKYLG